MDSFDCDWFTTIIDSNQKAINLAVKTGFEFVKKVLVKDFSTGSIVEMNLYKRSKI